MPAVGIGSRLLRSVVELPSDSDNVRAVDLEPLLNGPVFEPLTADGTLFRQVLVAADAGTIVGSYLNSKAQVPHEEPLRSEFRS